MEQFMEQFVPRRWWAVLGLAEAERLMPGRNQSPGTVENRLTSNSVRSSLVTESMNFVFHFVLAFLCYYVCYFNPVQLTLSLSPSPTNNPQHFTHVSPAPHPSHRVYAPQSFECRSIRNLWRPNRDGAEHDIMRKKMNCHSFLPIVKRKSPSPGMRNDVQFMRFQQSHLGPISSFLRCLNIK